MRILKKLCLSHYSIYWKLLFDQKYVCLLFCIVNLSELKLSGILKATMVFIRIYLSMTLETIVIL